MLLLHSRYSVRVWTPAKVNLFLEVIRRRPDGYHDLATLMLTVGLYDSLNFRQNASGDVHLKCDRPDLSTGPDNLVCRAANLVRERYGIRTGVDIELTKRIPLAAGLAGGSSDAAATLAGLNRLWSLGLNRDELGRLGAELGSDVTFFFYGPAAWCTGRGEIIEPLSVRRRLHLVLACPAVGLSTASVFKALNVPTQPRDGVAIRQALAAVGRSGEDIEPLAGQLFNRLEEPAFRLCPEVGRLKQTLREEAAKAGLSAGVLMSGSGSTVFALVNESADALRLSRALTAALDGGVKARVHVVRSCD